MTDILGRLYYGEVLARPFTLQEAREHIEALRAELDRERRWSKQLERCVLDHINRGMDDGES
jgi:hypothetical protein